MKFYLGVLFCCSFLFSAAQDSLRYFNAEQLIQIVKKYHPLVKQASLDIDYANADILQARSAFDPILQNYIAKKTFSGSNYYNYTNTELVIPTWYGIEVNTGLEMLTGNRLDPERTTGRTSYFGVTIPLAKNLVIDKRRAALQQAKLYVTMAITERQVTINNILYDALQSYWQWVSNYQQLQVINNAVAVNQTRLVMVRKAYKYGERAAIDTVEALAQLQSFQYAQNEQLLNYNNATLQLSMYLWANNNQPYLLPPTIIPQPGWQSEVNIAAQQLSLPALLQSARAIHPELRIYNNKLSILEIDRKLKFQELLPKLDFTYNQLGKGYNLLKTATAGPLFDNNFQYGLKFAVPLRLSGGRASYSQAKLKIQQTTLEQNQKTQLIELKVKSYYNELITLQQQLILQANNLANYNRLVRAEEIRFENGESSLFLINIRENKALEAQQKLVELQAKYYKSIYALQWAAGLLQ